VATLHAIDDLWSLARSEPHPERQAGLERVARAAGAQDLWTFALVEDDLFLRDCVGAVPGNEEIAAVVDALEANGSVPARGRARSRRVLVFPPRFGPGPVLAAAIGLDRAEPGPRGLELLACLGEVLGAAEATAGPHGVHGSPPETPPPAGSPGGSPEREAAVPDPLRRRLDGLAAEIVRDALDRADGDHPAAAVHLGISEDELIGWIGYLGAL
jgi:hypothetical protein